MALAFNSLNAFMHMASQEGNGSVATANPIKSNIPASNNGSINAFTQMAQREDAQANPNTIMQALTYSMDPGAQQPTIGQTLTDIAGGIGKGLQSMFHSPAYPEVAGLGTGLNKLAQRVANPIENYPISQKLGVSQDPVNQGIEKAVATVSPYALGLLGGAGSVAETAGPEVGSEIGAEISSPKFKQSIPFGSKTLKGIPRSQAISNALVEKDIPDFYDNANDAKNNALKPLKPYLSGDKSSVDVYPYLTKESLANADPSKGMFGGIFKPQEVQRFYDANKDSLKLTHPELFDNDPSSSPQSIFPEDIREGLSKNSQALHSKLMEDPTKVGSGNNLWKLHRQLGNDIFRTDPASVGGSDRIYASKQARNITGQMLEDHFSKDPTGQALPAFQKVNQIYNQYLHPLKSTELLRNILSKTAGKVLGVDPDKLISDIGGAAEKNKIPLNNPLVDSIKNLNIQRLKESAPPGVLKKGFKYAGMTGLGLTGLGEIPRAYKEIFK
jgi:hypothetical protein